MNKLYGLLSFSVGGALLVLGLAFAIGDMFPVAAQPMGDGILIGMSCGFVAFWLVGYGLMMILGSKEESEPAG